MSEQNATIEPEVTEPTTPVAEAPEVVEAPAAELEAGQTTASVVGDVLDI